MEGVLSKGGLLVLNNHTSPHIFYGDAEHTSCIDVSTTSPTVFLAW